MRDAPRWPCVKIPKQGVNRRENRCSDFFELFDTLLQVISVVIKTQAKVFGLFITVFGAVPSVLKKKLSSEFIKSVSIFLDRKEA